jgi:hypothetical protein
VKNFAYIASKSLQQASYAQLIEVADIDEVREVPGLQQKGL